MEVEEFAGCVVPDDLPDDDVDGVLERQLAHVEAWPEWLPDGHDDSPPDGACLPGFGDCDPSGWLALELDSGTADPARLTDADLVEAIVGFDRVGSWAAARQARLLAELAGRRPADRVAHVARSAGVASEFAPDEVGVALHLARGTAAARLHLAEQLLSVLPATHALWETHHLLKHHTGWTITTHPDGRLTWTTPTGHHHTTAPHDYGPHEHGPEPPPTKPPPTGPPIPAAGAHDADLGPPPF